MTVDLVFVIDCTGSMKPILGSIKAQVGAIIDGENSVLKKVKEEHPDLPLRIRVGFLGFGIRVIRLLNGASPAGRLVAKGIL